MNYFSFIFGVIFLLFNFKSKAQLVRGADIGWLSEMEQSGRVFKDSNGVQRDLLDILDDYCVNSVRLRVWVNPAGGWSGKQDVINVAKRASAKGYKIFIDFHYSDTWSDPGQQTKPVAWANYSVTQLTQAIYDHTLDVLNGLKAANISPYWVQVGNETNDGMLWPDGRATLNLANYAKFVTSGYNAVKAVFPNAKVVVHLANGFDNVLYRWNIGSLVNNGAKFDVIGMSFYPTTPAEWQTYSTQSLANMRDMVATYNKEIMISEIGVSVSAPNEAKLFVEQSINNLLSLANNKGIGIFWWEPQAYDWRGYDKVAWNSSTLKPTLAMNGFKYKCPKSSLPDSSLVTFKVNASATSTSNGIFITGAFNGPTWVLFPMKSEGNNIYSFTKKMALKDSGAYYYLNANDWTARETVPQACVKWYGVDRGYKISSGNQTINDVWASCGILTSLNNDEANQQIKIYPIPSKNHLYVEVEGPFKAELYTTEGQLIATKQAKDQCEFQFFENKGLFYLRIQNSKGTKYSKAIFIE